MAGVAAANALLPLVEAYQPRCIAMCGVCAGHPGKTNLGDVVAADRLFFHDLGKREPGGMKNDLQTYNLREDWKVALEHFDFAGRFRNEQWWLKRPVPYEWQENWVLAMLHQEVADPASHPGHEVYCPQWEKVIESLWRSGHVQDGTLTITEEGRKRIGKFLIKHRNRLPDLSPTGEVLPFKVHVAPMGSGNQVIEDKAIWDSLTESMRKTAGLEMEAATIGAIAHSQRDKRLEPLVMKGVMDFANQGRDDNFKKFAGRASAECLLAFLREQLDVETVPGVDDLLVSGTAELPETPPPSALLNALYEVIPFHEKGRESILIELTRWSEEGPPVAVRLLHAEGGVGKTRLAIEWSRRRKAQGWAAGFLPKEVPEDWFERLWACGQHVLVVIDYAESHTALRSLLLRVLRYAQQEFPGSPHRIRLLLLARNAGDWWQSLRQFDVALGAWLGSTPPHELEPLAPQLAERDSVFHEAAERFANKRGRAYQRRAAVPLTDARFERVLYIHMAALASVEGLEFAAHTLMDVVLDHEERFWEKRAELDDVKRSFQRSMARQLVAAATLRGGFADLEAAVRVMERLFRRATLSADEQELLWLVHRVYQRQGTKSLAFLPALEPDLLGEGMVLRVASPKQEEERLPADWIARVFPFTEEAECVEKGFEVLGHASAVSAEVVRPWIERLLAGSLHQRAVLALVAAKAVGLRTAFSALGNVLAEQLEAQGDARLARELEAVGLPKSAVSLRRVAVWVSRTLLHALERADEEVALPERALHQLNLSSRLLELGRREEALTPAQEAVKASRVLVQKYSVAFQPNLAMSLTTLGVVLGELGRGEEALAATQEAVDTYRVLVQGSPDAFLPYLAIGLNNLGVKLSELGRSEEALAATQEAVALHRALAQRNPDAFQPNLALGLSNLSLRLSELGRGEEALAPVQEAVDAYRVLIQRHPDAFLPDLAMGLTNLGVRLSEIGRGEEALAATQEAVDAYRALAQRNPDAFQSDLAGNLSNLGGTLSKFGRREEALAPAQEAVEVYRVLVQKYSDAFQPKLAISLTTLGVVLSELGRGEEALAATQEAVALHRALAQRNPGAFQPNLANSLSNLSLRLIELGRGEEALAATQEAVAQHRALVQRNPDAFQPGLGISLNNLGVDFIELGRREEAVTATQEAVETYLVLAQRNPDAFQPGLADSLSNLGGMLSELGRTEEALAAFEGALDNIWPYFKRHPLAFMTNVGRMFRRLLQIHEALQRPLPSLLGERIEEFERLLELLQPPG
jgi:tetratricopeptide (TPR) repeat protein/nucleoside phosphorylase